MSDLAKDVAREMDRRRMRRRWTFAAVWIAAVVLAAGYIRCGHGWGLGGAGSGSGPGSGPGAGSAAHDQGPRHCRVRVAAHGITVDGKRASRAGVVAACRTTGGADVIVTGDARQGDWDALKAALEAAHVKVFVH